jgi:hypothetical protein
MPKVGSTRILVATLPPKWSMRTTLSLQAVVQGTTAYAPVTTKATVLRRAG